MKLPRFSLLKDNWRVVVPVVVVVAGVALLLLVRLGSLTHGLGQHEVRLHAYTHNVYNIIHNPLNAPINLLHWLASVVDPGYGQTVTRLPSVVYGILTLIAMHYIMRKWYGRRAGYFGIVLFACSSWFLHNSRLGTDDIMHLWALPWLLATFLFWDTYRKAYAWASFLAIANLLLVLYVPGMVWLLIVALALQPHHLTETWIRLTALWQRLLAVAMILAVVASLAVAFAHNPSVGREWLALPQRFNTSQTVVHHLAQSLTFAIYRGPIAPENWLDRMPVLDIFTMVMALAGLLYYLRHINASLTRLLFGLGLVSALLFSLGGPVNYGVIVSLWYILAAGGLGYLLREWLHVFPRNPLARGAGYGLISLALALSCIYNLRSYFVAWPHNPTTIASFKYTIKH